ncbi:ubiquitin carboxyl-terminal hydrolase 13 [Quercus suber]|uniref:ubiquitinyl hydrolase 1 n=1 Tax=Quercus suber TaxID=58331 RepID=A0AAW0KLF8_QUESU
MLVHYDQTSDILYYEVLDIPLPELQGLKTLKVAVHQATKIPEEEKNLGPNDRLIHKIENFGEPFFMVMHEGETLAEIKVRIQKKLQVPDEEFAKWKFAFLSQGRPEYLQDSDIVSSHFQIVLTFFFNVFLFTCPYGDGPWQEYLGLEHSDNAHK